MEYKDSRSAEIAYNRGDGRRIDGVRVLVDKELGRTDKYWLPRRLGGGRGDTRRSKAEETFIKDVKKELKDR